MNTPIRIGTALLCAIYAACCFTPAAAHAASCACEKGSAYLPTSFDLDGDGDPDIVTYDGDWPNPTLKVARQDGSSLWTWKLDRREVCPQCADDWYWFPVTFAELDPDFEGREALIQWYDYGSHTGGITVVSPSRRIVVATLPGVLAEQTEESCEDTTGEPAILLHYAPAEHGDLP